MTKEVELFIAISSARHWPLHFGNSLIGLVYRLATNGLGDVFSLKRFVIKTIGNASCLSMSREANLKEALDNGFTHILMLDDDMIFPDTTVERMLAHGKSIVACNYMRKGNGEPTAQDMEGKLINSAERTGIESVYSSGLGVVLVELAAIKHIGAPHYAVMWDGERKVYWGEDLYFCELVRGSGVEIWLDNDLSRHISHVGDYGYSFPETTVLKLVKPDMKAA